MFFKVPWIEDLIPLPTAFKKFTTFQEILNENQIKKYQTI